MNLKQKYFMKTENDLLSQANWLENFVSKSGDKMSSPLADRLRPKKIEEVAGQRQLLAEGKVL